jgi:GNAT superfamily N-acetyltransferase
LPLSAWHRRQGVAGKLLQACESVAAAAGFWTFFIQADLKQQDKSGAIFPKPARRYNAAVEAYQKAGYTVYSRTDKPSLVWSKSATLMFKVFAP